MGLMGLWPTLQGPRHRGEDLAAHELLPVCLLPDGQAKARGYRKIRTLITIAYLIAGKLKFNVAELWPAPAKATPKAPGVARFRPSPVLG